MKFKSFVMKVLNGVAIAIVVALIPNAILGGLFKYLGQYHEIFKVLEMVCKNIQWLVAPMSGFLVGLQFGFNPMKSAIISAATWIGSGALSPVLLDGKLLYSVSLGDLINVMLVAAIAAYVTMLLGEKLGSLTLVLQPIIVGAGVGFIGLLMLPYVKAISVAIGLGIEKFTSLQPILMAILIAMSFSVIIISPISTVAIAYAIGLSGLASGAANLGIVATTAVLVMGSIKVNKSGVSVAILLGAMKMMIPNLVKNPIMLLPVLTNSFIVGLSAKLFNITGDKVSAGFGIAGLVGPIKAFSEYKLNGLSGSIALINILLVYFVIPFGAAYILQIVYTKIFKIYKEDIYLFEN